ncbi:MAG: preprotein translocase subunit SecY [Alphaproteobacteria bacterium]|nr:preprotein translocase subunit SecY [Alphaproteobacteria bacterium]
MASAAEQLAGGFGWGAFGKATDLKKRLWFTLGALVVYRLGSYIPIPGVDPQVLTEIFNAQRGGILGMFDMLAGGALGRMTLFALNIMPYISASIIIQLMTAVSPTLETLKKEGATGRQKLNQYTRYLTLVLALFQSYGIALGLQNSTGQSGPLVLINPVLFQMTTVVTLTGGTMFLMWLGEQITARGVGNGTSLIIFAGIVANLPSALAALLELGRTGALSSVFIILMLLIATIVIGAIVFLERAQRRILVQYPKRQVGNKMYGGQSSHLPLKINTSGVIPPIFASSLLLLPLTFANFTTGADAPAWMQWLTTHLAHGQPLYILFYVALIVFFAFFYTAVVFNPVETADNLKKYGGFVPGIRPGKNTADYFDYVLTRLTVLGAAYLAAICVLPEILVSQYSVPFYFGGTSLLIVVSVTMDTVAQIHSHLIAHQYEGLIKKAKLKPTREPGAAPRLAQRADGDKSSLLGKLLGRKGG